jgi:hypothetical protein
MDSHNTEFYDITKLYEIQEKKYEIRKKVFESILRKIHHQIDTVSQRGDVMLLYKIPEFVMGTPTYNPMNCVNYATKRLSDEGFKVKYVNPYILFINWQRDTKSSQVSGTIENKKQEAKPVNKLTYNPTGKLFN